MTSFGLQLALLSDLEAGFYGGDVNNERKMMLNQRQMRMKRKRWKRWPLALKERERETERGLVNNARIRRPFEVLGVRKRGRQ